MAKQRRQYTEKDLSFDYGFNVKPKKSGTRSKGKGKRSGKRGSRGGGSFGS
jgi:hypothetical protein